MPPMRRKRGRGMATLWSKPNKQTRRQCANEALAKKLKTETVQVPLANGKSGVKKKRATDAQSPRSRAPPSDTTLSARSEHTATVSPAIKRHRLQQNNGAIASVKNASNAAEVARVSSSASSSSRRNKGQDAIYGYVDAVVSTLLSVGKIIGPLSNLSLVMDKKDETQQPGPSSLSAVQSVIPMSEILTEKTVALRQRKLSIDLGNTNLADLKLDNIMDEINKKFMCRIELFEHRPSENALILLMVAAETCADEATTYLTNAIIDAEMELYIKSGKFAENTNGSAPGPSTSS
ncbi:unnamed protein product [Caenorhabditis sp. 36 PRJEB53466]|nr:unnamed protein product [Caenorhabditis sp. 36 PRJEB53466]